MQRTVRGEVRFQGIGLHSGRPVRLVVHPASADTGIWFRRTDLAGNPMVAAHWSNGVASPLCTLIRNEDGVSVSTIEHLMAALAGLGVMNAVIDIDGPEVPILDGSSAGFVAGLLRRGLRELDTPVRAIAVREEVRVEAGEAWASLSPANGLEIDFSIDFDDPAIGRQAHRLNMANGAFVHELAACRTFCLQEDVDRMRAEGLALGGSLANAVVFDHGQVVNPEGLRRRDEPVRHKMLDALGDLALAGAPLLARYRGHRAGHALTGKLLRALFSRAGAAELVTVSSEVAARLPGRGVVRADLAAVA